jgi:hypothetical protein
MIPMNQRLIVADLNFPVLRILILFVMLRFVIRNEIQAIQWNNFDKLYLAWKIIGTIVYVLLWGNLHALVYKCGEMYDSIGFYWIFRMNIKSFDNISAIIKAFAAFAIISAPFTAAEKIFHSSVYSFFGPVGAGFHRGRYQCAGPFPHFIIMGVFWASLLPLFYSRIKEKLRPGFYWIAILSALSCIYYSAASTPIMTVVAIIIFWMMYPVRINGKGIFGFVCFLVLTLHLVMKAPVWHLMSRVDVFGGSTGWFRYHLFDEFIKHISDWFFLGTESTHAWGEGLEDVTNQYILEAVRGGFLTMFIFIMILYKAVKITGRYSLLGEDTNKRFISWGICVTLLGHIITFWGVSYFGQIEMLLTMTFAITGFINDETSKLYNS